MNFPINTIGIRNIFTHPSLRLTVYYLKAGTIMKLHDHNQMNVVSVVLSGEMEAKVYRKEVEGNREMAEKMEAK